MHLRARFPHLLLWLPIQARVILVCRPEAPTTDVSLLIPSWVGGRSDVGSLIVVSLHILVEHVSDGVDTLEIGSNLFLHVPPLNGGVGGRSDYISIVALSWYLRRKHFVEFDTRLTQDRIELAVACVGVARP